MQRIIAVLLTAALLLAVPGQPCYAALGRVAAGTSAGPAATGAAGAAGRIGAHAALGALHTPLYSATLNTALPSVENLRLQTAVQQAAVRVTPRGIAGRTYAPRGKLGKTIERITGSAQPFRKTIAKPAASAGQTHSAGTDLQNLLSGVLHSRRDSAAVLPRVGAGLAGFKSATPAGLGIGRARLINSAHRGEVPGAAADALQAAAKTTPAAAALRRAWHALKRAVLRPVLGLTLLISLIAAAPAFPDVKVDLLAQQGTPPAGQTVSQQAPEVIIAPIAAAVKVSPQSVTVGETMELEITLRNNGGKTLEIPSVRAAVERSLPFTLELRGQEGVDAIELAPGESRTVVLRVAAFDAGEIKLEGVRIYLGADGSVIVVPDAVFKVDSVLTPDWKKKGFEDIAEIQKGETPNIGWLFSIPLGLLLLIGVERLLASRRQGRKPKVFLQPLWETTSKRIGELTQNGGRLSSAVFYAEVYNILDTLLIDLHGLEKRERGAGELIRDIAGAKKYSKEQLALARRIAETAEAVRFGGAADNSELRRRTLTALNALAEDLLAPAPPAEQDPPSLLGLGALFSGGGAGLSFGQPWALLLVVPLGAYLLWRMWRSPASSFKVSSADTLPGKRTWRQRLRWMPSALRIAAVTLLLLALSQPRIGVERQETYVPSTDTVMSIDLSGSMDTKFGTGDKISQLEAARSAVKAYVIEQRRGTTNRVGMVTFADDSYQDVRLTTDYDALIAHLKELKTSGSTAVGKSVLASITHFLEVNAYELNDPDDPRIKKVQELLDKKGLGEALEYAKKHSDLMRRILQPDRTKIVVLFSDGGSNTGLSMAEAADIAKKLGVRIYTVGINTSGTDEKNLKDMSESTGGLYFQVGNAEGMRAALLDISRLEKSPSLVKSKIATKDFGSYLLMLALLMLGLEVTLSSTRMRSLSGVALIAALGLAIPNPELIRPLTGGGTPIVMAAATTEAPAKAPLSIVDQLPVSKMPRELAAANTLYLQGRFDEAVKKYAEALRRYPDIPQIYFNTANALYRLGDFARAAKYYQEYLKHVKDDAGESSKVFYNLANAALMQKDLSRAIELYREALRRNSGYTEAKWNLEVAMQMLKEQQKNQQGKKGEGKGKKQKGKGQPGDSDGQGEPGDSDGDSAQSDGKDGKKSPGKPGKPKQAEQAEGVDKLQKQQDKIEKEGDAKARKAVPRKGSGIWGLAAIALAGPAALSFTNPVLLWSVFVLVPIMAGLLIYSLRKKLQAARELSELDAPKSFKEWAGRRRWTTKFALLLSALALFALAAGDPIFGERDTRLNFGGKDIMMATDVSRSMLGAEDGRHERTKAELMEFIRRMEGTDRVGLVVFAGKARTASPLSIDYGNFEFKMRRLEREARSLNGGSDLAAAIEHSILSFDTVKKIGDRERILIVISDGDIFEQELEKVIRLAKSKGIAIYTIGVGTTDGTRIALPEQEGDNGETQYLIDEKTGQPALTRLNEKTLRLLSHSTGGEYFRAQNDSGINSLLSRVAELSKGTETDSVKSPRKIAAFFMWPGLALLLLELLLPGISPLRNRTRTRKEGQDKAGKATALHGAALLGLALPLSFWPQVLPFAALITLFAGLILYDLLSRGGAARRILAWAHRGEPAANLERDLGILFDSPETGKERFREMDRLELRRFLREWQSAPGEDKTRLINTALGDRELWRQKLTTAYLAASVRPSKDSAETADMILGALAAAARTHLDRLEPVLNRLIDRRAELAWLNHPLPLRALARLAQQGLNPKHAASRATLRSLAAEPDAAVRQAALASLLGMRAPPSRLSWTKRAGVTLLALVMAAMVMLSSFSGIKTLEYRTIQKQAVQTQLSIFFGDDLYILNDKYADARIQDEVVPVLKRWHRTDAVTQQELMQAIAVLRSSPDPKADNVLEAVFKLADMLPLTVESENLLLKTLIERDNDQVWEFLKRYMQANAKNPMATGRLLRMIQIGAEAGSDRVFVNLFYFLTSPSPQVRDLAAKEIGKSLNAPTRTDQFIKRLNDVSTHHAEDPFLQLWVQYFTLDRLMQAGAESLSLDEAGKLIDHVLATAQRIDIQRVEALKQLKPGQEAELPPALQEQTVAILLNALRGAQQRGAISAPLNLTVIESINKQTKSLIEEAYKHFADLHESELKSTQGSYRLADLNKLREVLAEKAAAIKNSNQPLAKEFTAEQREFVDRAQRVLSHMIPAAELAGIQPGGTAGEKAADEINLLLVEGQQKFDGDQFVRALRRAGLAPDANISVTADKGFYQSYSPEEIEKLRGFLLELVQKDISWETNGQRRSLDWNEKKYLAGALEKVVGIHTKHYAGNEAPTAQDSATVLQQLTALQDALNGGDQAAAGKAEKALRGLFADAEDADLFLAKVVAAQEALAAGPAGKDARANLALLRFLAARISEGANLHAEGLKEVFADALEAALDHAAAPDIKPLPDAETWTAVRDALAGIRDSGRPVPETLTEAIQKELNDQAVLIADGGKEKFKANTPAGDRYDRRLREARIFKDSKTRDKFKLFHLRELRQAIAESAGDAEYAAEADGILERMLETAQLAGAADGGSVSERLAEEMNDILYAGYMAYPGTYFNDMLRAAKLAPEGAGNAAAEAYHQSYSPETARRIYIFYEDMLRSGQYTGGTGKENLSEAHKLHLAEGLEKIAHLLEKFHPQALEQLAPRPFGMLFRTLADGAPGLQTALDAAAADGSLLARLAIVQKLNEKDAPLQRRILHLTLERLGGAHGQQYADDDLSMRLLDGTVKALLDRGQQADIWQLLTDALKSAEVKDGLSRIAQEKVHDYLTGAITAAEEAFPVNDALVESKVRATATAQRKSFRLIHITRLRRIILDSAAAAAKSGGLSAPQKLAQETAARDLPRLRKLAELSGMLPGDSQGEVAAETVNTLLHDGHMKFTGQNFVKYMRSQKLAADQKANQSGGITYDQELTWRQSYSTAEVAEILAQMRAMLKGDVSWDHEGKPRSLTPDEKTLLEGAVKTLEGLLEHYPNPAPEDKAKVDAAVALRDAAPAPVDAASGATGFPAFIPVTAGLTAASFSMPAFIGGWLPVVAIAAFAALGLYLLARSWRGRGNTNEQAAGRAPAAAEPSAEALKRYKRLEIAARKMASAVTAGQFRSRLVGASGTDFVELADYHNEDRKAINWKASAKRDELQVNRYEQHKDMPLVLLIDVSDSSVFGTRGTDKKTVIEDTAALLALMASHLNIRVGALLFSDRVEEFIPPKSGKRHVWHILRRLMQARPESTGTDLNVPLSFALKRLRSRSMVAMVSDFIAPDYARSMGGLSERHDFRPIRVTDPAEMRPLPDVGLLRTQDAETGGERWVDTSSRAGRAEQLANIRARERRIEDAFHAARTRPVTLSTETEYMEELTKEFSGKKK